MNVDSLAALCRPLPPIPKIEREWNMDNRDTPRIDRNKIDDHLMKIASLFLAHSQIKDSLRYYFYLLANNSFINPY